MNQQLLQVIASLKSTQDLERFFQEMFTPRELADLSLRWELLKELHQGMPQRSIAKKYSISLCKITRGSKILKTEGSMVRQLLESKKTNEE